MASFALGGVNLPEKICVTKVNHQTLPFLWLKIWNMCLNTSILQTCWIFMDFRLGKQNTITKVKAWTQFHFLGLAASEASLLTLGLGLQSTPGLHNKVGFPCYTLDMISIKSSKIIKPNIWLPTSWTFSGTTDCRCAVVLRDVFFRSLAATQTQPRCSLSQHLARKDVESPWLHHCCEWRHTWWFIPLSKWLITLVINGISGVSPLITRVITHLRFVGWTTKYILENTLWTRSTKFHHL